MTLNLRKKVNKKDFPIKGWFKSKRGTSWFFRIDSDGFVEQWHNTIIRCAGGWKTGKDIYAYPPTKECINYIKEHYNLEILEGGLRW